MIAYTPKGPPHLTLLVRTKPTRFVQRAEAHLGFARPYVLSGDTSKAKATYNDFFTLWKDAGPDPDPDIPIVQQTKSEYAKLKSSARRRFDLPLGAE